MSNLPAGHRGCIGSIVGPLLLDRGRDLASYRYDLLADFNSVAEPVRETAFDLPGVAKGRDLVAVARCASAWRKLRRIAAASRWNGH